MRLFAAQLFVPLLVLPLLCCTGGFADPGRELGPAVDTARDGEVAIHRPPGLGVVDTPLRDVHGAPIGVSCDTCHGPDAQGEVLADDQGNPEGIHDSVALVHGEASCGSCHDLQDKRWLHLADGSRLEMGEAFALCQQCHGPQTRDFLRGSHGGMTGAWDLRRGDRVRNHCLDCHDAHRPAWGQVEPVFPPQDRGTVQMRSQAAEGQP